MQERYKVGSIVKAKRTITFLDNVEHKKCSRHIKGSTHVVTSVTHAYYNMMWHDYILISGEIPK